MTKSQENWEAIYREMARTRQLLADEKKTAEIQALAAAKQGSPTPESHMQKKRPRGRPVSYHDDSKEKWELRNSDFKGGFDRE